MKLDLVGLQMPEAPEQRNQRQISLRPLERGFGHTLGNTMRRILLSSLRGSAVWAFRTDGVLHEHQTIPGIVEDVHEVVKNLKALVLSMDEGVDDAVLVLQAEKAGPVTGLQIQDNPHVSVVNPDHHLAELNEDREFRMELHVNKGRGFVLAEQHSIPRGMPADLVRVDAIYNPVRRANFVVEETRVGQRTDFDRLVLEVDTNGAMDASTAVQYAARLAIEHFGYLSGGQLRWGDERSWADGDGDGADSAAPSRVLIPSDVRALLETPIQEVEGIPTRSRNTLQKGEIETVRHLVEAPEAALRKVDSFGPKSFNEVAEFLESHGLHFGMRIEEADNGLMWRVTGGDEAVAEPAVAREDDQPGEGGSEGSDPSRTE